MEFQGQNRLAQDCVVGPVTRERLLALINGVGPGIVAMIFLPADEMAAGKTMAAVTSDHLRAFGGFNPATDMGSVKIAGSLCSTR